MVLRKDKIVHFLIVTINNCTCNAQYTGIIRMNFVSTIKYIAMHVILYKIYDNKTTAMFMDKGTI